MVRLRSAALGAVLACIAVPFGDLRAQLPAPQPMLSVDVGGIGQVLLRQNDGKVLLGGLFNKVNGTLRFFLARFNADGTLDNGFAPDISDDQVTAIAVTGTSVYVAGDFTFIDGIARPGLAKLSIVDGSIDPAFMPTPGGGSVKALATDGAGNVYAAGTFTSIGGVTGRNLVKLNGATGLADASWNPSFPTALSAISAIGINGTFLYVAGQVATDVNGFLGRAHRVTVTTGVYDSTWAPALSHVNNVGTVAMAFDAGGNVFLASTGGLTASAPQTAIITVEKLQAANGAADPTWVPPSDAANIGGLAFVAVDAAGVYTITTSGQTAMADSGGALSIARRDAATGAIVGGWTAPNGGGTFGIFGALPTPEGVWVTGQFSRLNGNLTPGLARLDATTGAVQTAFTGRITLPGYGLAVAQLADGKFLFGGSFDYVNDIQRSNLARLNADGSFDPTFTLQANGEVRKLVVQGTQVYAGGFFTSIGGVARGGGARFDVTTGAVDGWNPNANGSVRRFAFDGTDVFLVGGFTSVGGAPRYTVAKVSGLDGSLVTAFAPPLDSTCQAGSLALAYTSGVVYSGIPGPCTAPGVAGRGRLVRFNSTTGAVDTSVGPIVTGGPVRDMIVVGTTAYIGGSFTTVAGQSKPRLAKFTTTTGALDATWGDVPVPSVVVSLGIVGPFIYTGGMTATNTDPVADRHLLSNGLRDQGWNPPLDIDTVPGYGVTGIDGSLNGDRVFLAGNYYMVSRMPYQGVVAYPTIGGGLTATGVTPCRLIDTRNAVGPLPPRAGRSYSASDPARINAAGGNPSGCSVPAGATALSLTITAVLPDQVGNLVAYPAGTSLPLASTLNFLGSQIVANTTVVPVTPGAGDTFSLYNNSDGNTPVVVDVVGYFWENQASDCNKVTQTQSLANGVTATVTATCAAGYVAIGGGCSVSGGSVVWQDRRGTTNGLGFGCTAQNNSGVSATVSTDVGCCRKAGR